MLSYKKFLTFDFRLQTVLIGLPLLLMIISFIEPQTGLWIYSVFGLIFIGAWQLISGLVLAAGFQNRLRVLYLIIATVFLLLFYFLPNELFYDLGTEKSVLLLFSVLIAIWYYIITYRDYQRERSRAQSFWDLEV